MYDLLISGGIVVDPAAGVHERQDVARGLGEERHSDLDWDDVQNPRHHPGRVPRGVGGGGDELRDDDRQDQSGRALRQGEPVIRNADAQQWPSEVPTEARAIPVAQRRPP